MTFFSAVPLTGLLALFFLVFRLPTAAQTPTWQSAQAVAAATGAGSSVTATAVDAVGNVYLAGVFATTVTLGTTTLTSFGSEDIFVAKFNPTSNQFVWAQSAGGTSLDQPNTLSVSGNSVYVAGIFYRATARFGAVTLPLAGTSNGFVAKLTDAGNTGSFTWVQQTSANFTSLVTALAVSGSSVYVTGSASGTSASFGAITLTSAGGRDLFVAKLTDAGSTGSFVWAQQAGGAGSERASAVALSGAIVYVAGAFTSATASFGPLALTNPRPNAQLGFLASLADPTLTATAGPRAESLAQLFPNPARSTATLRLPASTMPTPLTLLDAKGRSVRRYPAPAAAETSLDLRGLPAGLYLLRGTGLLQRLLVE
ncbi:T9SS type A sorting domain-containing protein [Hymenobacter arizonensis]|uniref:Por secretion system C-terminal sorting domain-containing protein n=1 Tax=Hymenobacter arizonensis TaxID=1227077 RepID=A0A1I6BCM5_HYMAR|nr:T9SS type A sorting domain-containing protein [Hymenobacter arizonensis]SFQ78693.1 Por secretion system C-terminal sorting domain-containing protein [Hymenobacter arizonensis]